MNNFSHVPPGFRFHPTDEELVDYYLRKKIASKRIDLNVIKDVDLYRIEPWDLEEICKMGSEEQSDWYFFSHKDKKYPTGTRTNRATRAGFWKATGRDKAIYTKNCLIGMRKTLVFYKGRAPNGQKSDWIMHEYRLETNENGTSQEEGWVVCRVFKKRIAATTRDETLCWYGDQLSFMPDFDSPTPFSQPHNYNSHINHHPHYSCKQEPPALQYNNMHHHDAFLQLPPLESPKLPNLINNPNAMQSSSMFSLDELLQHGNRIPVDPVTTDWRVLDKFVASQLSQDNGGSEEAEYSKGQSLQVAEDLNLIMDDENEDDSKTHEMTSSSSPLDLWK